MRRFMWACQAILIGEIVMLAMLGIVLVVRITPLWSQEAAGWAQAIGTILAIGAAWIATTFQLRHAEAMTEKKQRETDASLAQIAFHLANDTHRVLNNVYEKFRADHKNSTHNAIGEERLISLLEALQTFTGKDIRPVVYAQLLILQREVSYALTAIRQHNRRNEVTAERVQRSLGRLSTVFDVRQTLRRELEQAKAAAQDTTDIEWKSATDPDE